jgi:hypothetical protein
MAPSIFVFIMSSSAGINVCTGGPQGIVDSRDVAKIDCQSIAGLARGVSCPMMLNILLPMANATVHQGMQVPR